MLIIINLTPLVAIMNSIFCSKLWASTSNLRKYVYILETQI